MFVRSQDYSVNISFEKSKVSILSNINTLESHQVVFSGTHSENALQRHSNLFSDEYLHQIVLKGFKHFVFFRTRDSPKNISWST